MTTTINELHGVKFHSLSDAMSAARAASPGNWQVYGRHGKAPWYVGPETTTDGAGGVIPFRVHPGDRCVASSASTVKPRPHPEALQPCRCGRCGGKPTRRLLRLLPEYQYETARLLGSSRGLTEWVPVGRFCLIPDGYVQP